ncbi:MAG: pyruvate formate lyase family protein [Desulfobacterales bacterium]
MLQKLDARKTMLQDVLTVQPSPRVERLREEYLRSELVLSIDRDRIEARVLGETEGEPLVLRRAKAFAAIVREIPVEIFDDELIVGWFWGSPHGCAFSVKGDPTLEYRLDELTTRDRNPVTISEEQKQILLEEIIPFWKGNGKWELSRTSSLYDDLFLPELNDLMFVNGSPQPNGPINTRFMRGGHVGHTIANHEKVLEKGFLGIQKEAEDRLARLDLSDPEELKKIPFLKGVVIAMEAAAKIGQRFATRARALADDEKSPERKEDLLRIAKACDRAPAHPAETFHEALQTVWFVHILHWWETSGTAAISPGRVDQYLYPFYDRDIREGRLTEREAQELIDCYLLRFSAFTYNGVSDPEGNLTDALYGAAHHIDVGGYKPDGSDATNALSYMFIEGMMHTRLQEPNFGLLVHSKTPEDLLIKACQLCALGTGHPMFLNHDTIINNLLGRGTMGGPPISLELARTAATFGCNEPCVPGMDSGMIIGASISVPLAFEFALSNGWSRAHNRQLGPETGDPKSFASFEDFRDAFRKQLSWMIERASIANNIVEPLMASLESTVFQSALFDDCIEKGICREAGGARYNAGPFVSIQGSPDFGDSLAAMKKHVFDDKTITMDALLDALDRNFEGCESLHRKLLDTPKFGNDDDEADEQTVWLKHVFAEEVIKHKNTRGGHRTPVEIPLSGYVTGGTGVGALPSGRLAGQPLAAGIGPTSGSDMNGPTAVLNSVAKINHAEFFGGQTFNMRLDPSIFDDPSGFKRMADFIRTFVDLKIHQVQFNIVSSDVLEAAQEEPESYRDLMVRVAGYVTQFVELPRAVQNTIIARTEHGL